MTRTVADAAAELHAIAGPDPEDPATDGAPPVPDYLAGLKPDALAGKRIGVINNTERAVRRGGGGGPGARRDHGADQRADRGQHSGTSSRRSSSAT